MLREPAHTARIPTRTTNVSIVCVSMYLCIFVHCACVLLLSITISDIVSYEKVQQQQQERQKQIVFTKAEVIAFCLGNQFGILPAVCHFHNCETTRLRVCIYRDTLQLYLYLCLSVCLIKPNQSSGFCSAKYKDKNYVYIKINKLKIEINNFAYKCDNNNNNERKPQDGTKFNDRVPPPLERSMD